MHVARMNDKLRNAIGRYTTIHGRGEGLLLLANRVGRDFRTVQRWLKRGAPSAHHAYKLAVAAGCTEAEALAIAEECFPKGQRTA